MSNKANCEYASWLRVYKRILSRDVIFRRGLKLCEMDLSCVQDAYMLLYLTWYDSLTFLTGHSPSLDRLGPTWISTLCSADLFDVVRLCKSCDEQILIGLHSQMTYQSFKHSVMQSIPGCQNNSSELVGRFLGPLKEEIAEYLNSHMGGVSLISYFTALHQCFAFISRLSLTEVDDLEQEALDAYLSLDQDCPLWFSEEEGETIKSWFPYNRAKSLFAHYKPGHGSGSVADTTRNLYDKYHVIGTDARLQNLHNWYQLMTGVSFSDDDLASFLERNLMFKSKSVNFDRISKTIFVPKSATKLRTISMEPVSLMWHQQGFFRALLWYFDHHEYLRRRIALGAPDWNAATAWRGSVDGVFSTIDLSSASDCVRWPMVKQWFRNTPLMPALLACRSDATVAGGKLVNLNKFAPMGSALCFPVECIVFSAITESAIRFKGGNPNHSWYRVYGDDIVVETKYADAVIARLEENGFQVNPEKSFSNTIAPFFRESCGGEYLNGVNVTPIRIPRRFSGFSSLVTTHSMCVGDAPRIEGLIDLANECNTRLPSVRRFLIGQLVKLPKGLRPLFSQSGNSLLKSKVPTNYHVERRWNSDYQNYQYRGGCSKSILEQSVRDNPDYEAYRLYEWLRSKAPSGFEDEDKCLTSYYSRLFGDYELDRIPGSLICPDPVIPVEMRPLVKAVWVPKWQSPFPYC